MSFVLLGILNSQVAGGGAAPVYRIELLGGTNDDFSRNFATDSSNNLFNVGGTRSYGQGNYDSYLVKQNAAGEIQFQKTLGGTGSDDFYSVKLDSSDAVYVGGETNSTGQGSDDFILAKYDNSGSLQWQKTVGGSSNDQFGRIALDSSNNIYLAGRTASSGAGFGDMFVGKFNSSGTSQWQRTLGGASSEDTNAIAVDSANNVYIAGSTESQTGGIDTVLAKYNSSGTIQWQRGLDSEGNAEGKGIAIDSSDNIYLVGAENTAAGENAIITKYNSSGSLIWQRKLGGSADDEARAIVIDSADNLYVLLYLQSEGQGSGEYGLAKYSSGGTIQWQRTLGATGFDESLAIAIDSLDNLYITGITLSAGPGGVTGLSAVLPNDGSLTGTYSLDGVNFVYAASSLTAATLGLVPRTSTLTNSSASLTVSTSSLTAGTAALTLESVQL